MKNEHQVGGPHYVQMKIQPWEAMQAWMTREEADFKDEYGKEMWRD